MLDIDDQTPLGVSPRDVLDRLSETMEGELDWVVAGDGYELGLNTYISPVSMTIAVTYDGGSMTFIDQEPVEPEGQLNEVGLICSDRLAIDVALALTTSDGTLSESWPSSLVVDADPRTGEPSEPRLAVDTRFTVLTGTLAITSIEPETWSVSESLRVEASFFDGGSSGQLRVGITDPEGGRRTAELGAWQALAP